MIEDTLNYGHLNQPADKLTIFLLNLKNRVSEELIAIQMAIYHRHEGSSVESLIKKAEGLIHSYFLKIAFLKNYTSSPISVTVTTRSTRAELTRWPRNWLPTPFRSFTRQKRRLCRINTFECKMLQPLTMRLAKSES